MKIIACQRKHSSRCACHCLQASMRGACLGWMLRGSRGRDGVGEAKEGGASSAAGPRGLAAAHCQVCAAVAVPVAQPCVAMTCSDATGRTQHNPFALLLVSHSLSPAKPLPAAMHQDDISTTTSCRCCWPNRSAQHSHCLQKCTCRTSAHSLSQLLSPVWPLPGYAPGGTQCAAVRCDCGLRSKAPSAQALLRGINIAPFSMVTMQRPIVHVLSYVI